MSGKAFLDSGNNEPGQAPKKKRKRRILSCETCRRLKCRCEFDEGYEACSRCRALRIPCLKDDDDGITSQRGSGNQLDHERRLENLELSMSEMRTMIEALPSMSRSGARIATTLPMEPNLRVAGTETISALSGVEPADGDVDASPAEVVRKVGNQLSGGYRRTFDAQQDIVSLGFLTNAMAQGLMKQFVRHRREVLLINDENDLTMGTEVRHRSAFLHAVCCLNGFRYSPEPCNSGSATHRQVYEYVRLMLGQVMIASPLPLEELTGILIMALFASSPSDGPEYIDSWLLSGHCAQQAMLSFNFSEIISRIKLRLATSVDQKMMRVWASICLVNLHWAATTGRPPTIPTNYLRQYECLLNFEQVTIKDVCIHAEILLFITLHEKLAQKSYLKVDGSCEELTAWKQKWAYLFELPTVSTLKMSEHIAWLVLARRSLERRPSMQRNDAGSESGQSDNASAATTPFNAMQKLTCGFAIRVIESFIEMPEDRAEDLPEFHVLCVSYAMLVVSKYEHKPSYVSNDKLWRVLQSASELCNKFGAIPMSIRFGLKRALGRVNGVIQARTTESPPDKNLKPNFQSKNPHPTTESSLGTWALPQEETTDEMQLADVEGTFTLTGDEFQGMDFFFAGGYLGLGTGNISNY